MEASVLSSHRLKIPWSTSVSIRNVSKTPADDAWTVAGAKTLPKGPDLEKDLEKGEGQMSKLKMAQSEAQEPLAQSLWGPVGSFWG